MNLNERVNAHRIFCFMFNICPIASFRPKRIVGHNLWIFMALNAKLVNRSINVNHTAWKCVYRGMEHR